MAAPVHENGVAVGSLVVASYRPGRRYSQTEQDVLAAFAEHASLALTDARNFEDAMHQAFHDSLTGLPNRALFMDRLDHALLHARRHGETIAVLFLDLDRFKVVNDSLGHLVGDHLLSAVATRIQACVRDEDTVARLGGDEFTVLLENVAEGDEAVRVAGRIASALGDAFRLGGLEVFVTASVGIALNTPNHDDGTALLRDADVAMYRAKPGGRSRYEIFDPSMNVAALERLALESDLHHAVGPGGCAEFQVHYQPLVELASGRVAGLEALVRWRHPRRGLLAPGAFVALAEETGLIVPLGRWVLREACRQARAWQGVAGGHRLLMNVNLSARQLQDPDLATEVARTLAETGLAPNCLELEITESVLMSDAESSGRALAALQGLGVRLAIDDFGTGYSSLAYLKHLPVDTLKIDRSFVAGVARDPADAAIVGAVVTLARALGLAVTAEGVETAAELAHLQGLGCDRGQGYYFARPLPPEAATALIEGRAEAVAVAR
jgi:diguanylate cyclase (GGDEF)-like protein